MSKEIKSIFTKETDQNNSKIKKVNIKKELVKLGYLDGQIVLENDLSKEIFKLNSKAEEYYIEGNIEKTKELCIKSIKINRKITKLNISVYPYEKIVGILEKEIKYEEALKYINEFINKINQTSNTNLKDKWIKRKRMIESKLEK